MRYVFAKSNQAAAAKKYALDRPDTVYLNGKELYHYEKQKLDRIFNGTYVISLSLKKGSNELIFITEGDASFFGKGFNAMGRMQHQNWGFIAEIGPL